MRFKKKPKVIVPLPIIFIQQQQQIFQQNARFEFQPKVTLLKETPKILVGKKKERILFIGKKTQKGTI